MDTFELASEIQKIEGCELHPEMDLTRYTTMRLKSQGDLVVIKSIYALQILLPLLHMHKRKYLVVGWGANQILPTRCNDLILHLDFSFDQNYLNDLKDEYELPASIGLNHLTSHAVKFGLTGWEVFTGIPASLGGAIYMNAGTNLGEIGSLVKNVTLVTNNGDLKKIEISKNSFSYRKNHFVKTGDVIVGATLIHKGQDPEISRRIKDYLEYRKKTQPLATKNCGCVFKNPAKDLQAGRLIDLMGLKGLSNGSLRISPKHANFIENTDQTSTWEDFEKLVKIIQFNMNHFYGVSFELEVKSPIDL